MRSVSLESVSLAVLLAAFAAAEGRAARRDVEVRGRLPTIEEIRRGFEAGAQRQRFRDLALTPEDRRRLLDAGFLRELAGALPAEEDRRVEFRAREEGDRRLEVRVEREDDRELRLRIEGAVFRDAAEARALLRELRDDFDRVELRAVDAEGRRIRIEIRDRERVREAVGPERRREEREEAREEERKERLERREEREEREERGEAPERRERIEREDDGRGHGGRDGRNGRDRDGGRNGHSGRDGRNGGD